MKILNGTIKTRYIWNAEKGNQFIFYDKHNEEHKNIKTGKVQVFSSTKIIILKHGLKFDDRNPFHRKGDKEKLEVYFKENPEYAYLFHIFKNKVLDPID